jgi:hypothetical protein
MLDLAIRGTLILVFAFAAAGVMRRASAAARHLLWASALTGLLVLPAVVRLGPAVQVPVPVLASTAALAPDAAPVVIAEASRSVARACASLDDPRRGSRVRSAFGDRVHRCPG